MSRKSYFWDKLFSHSANNENHNLTAAEKRTLHDTLRDEYGISVTQEMISPAVILEKGYRRIGAAEVARLSSVFQYIPQIAAAHINEGAIQTAFNAVTEGTYRVRLEAGMHLCRSRLTPGAFRAVGLDNATNKIAGNAELFANDAALAVSKAPQIALCVFNVASLVTGQYFMSQVNGKLTELKGSVSRVEQYLDASQRSELKAAFQELEDITARLDFIKTNEQKVNSTVEQIHSVQRTAQKSMNLRQEQIAREKATANKTDEDVEIIRKLDAIGKYIMEYRYAAQLYCVATLLEVQLRGITDTDELSAYRTQMNTRVEQYLNDYALCENDLSDYLSKNHVLNDRSFLQNLATGATTVVSIALGGIAGIFPGLRLASNVDDLFKDNQKRIKAERVGYVKQFMDELSDVSSLLSPVKAVTNYISSVGKEIDIVKIGDEYYTNIPTDEL